MVIPMLAIELLEVIPNVYMLAIELLEVIPIDLLEVTCLPYNCWKS